MASTGDTWRLGHRPALDGLRGVAILLVIAGHTLLPAVHPYGPVGVDLFFALSGFLITSLLLEERSRDGGTDLAAFYRRRARRLLPAVFAFVVVVTIARVFVDGFAEAITAAAAVLLYVGNWAILSGADLWYLGHAWSLAVEEQFYIVWPFALAGLMRLPKHLRAPVCLCAIGAITVWRWHLGRMGAYTLLEQGSVERAVPILLGCALAFHMAGTRDRHSAPRVAGVLLVGLLAVSWLPYSTTFEHIGTGLISVGMIACVARGRGARFLEWGPLTLVGRRSYGLYLWHFPVLLPLMYLDLTGVARAGAIIVGLAAAWGLALLSWRYVEGPWRRRSSGGLVGEVEADLVAVGSPGDWDVRAHCESGRICTEELNPGA